MPPTGEILGALVCAVGLIAFMIFSSAYGYLTGVAAALGTIVFMMLLALVTGKRVLPKTNP